MTVWLPLLLQFTKTRQGQVRDRCGGDGNIQSEHDDVLSYSGDGIGGVDETTVTNIDPVDGGLDSSGTGEEGQSRSKKKHYG